MNTSIYKNPTISEWRKELETFNQRHMDTDISAKSPTEKFTWVLENTCIEVNRVLRNWRLSNLVVTRQDVNSVFRSYFAKFVKHQFGYRTYSSLVRWDKPQPVILNDRLMGIDVHDLSRMYPLFHEAMKAFNFSDAKLLPTKFIRSSSTQPLVETEDISNLPANSLIDYTKLEQFKY